MFELEVVVVVVGLRSETDFFHNYLGRLGFDFLGLLLLLVKILLIVEYLAYRRVGVGRNLYEVKLQLVGHVAGFLNGVYAGGDIFAYKAHLAGTYVLIDVVGRLLLLARVASALLSGALIIGGAGCSGIKGRFFIHSVCLAAVKLVF